MKIIDRINEYEKLLKILESIYVEAHIEHTPNTVKYHGSLTPREMRVVQQAHDQIIELFRKCLSVEAVEELLKHHTMQLGLSSHLWSYPKDLEAIEKWLNSGNKSMAERFITEAEKKIGGDDGISKENNIKSVFTWR